MESEIIFVGLGDFGCRILSKIEQQNHNIASFCYLSNNVNDFPKSTTGEKLEIVLNIGGKLSPAHIRGIVLSQLEALSSKFKTSKLVIIVSSADGGLGSALLPYLSNVCSNNNVKCLSILSMPFSFEKQKHFNAGLTLRHSKQYSDGIILINKDEIFNAFPQIPIVQAYDFVDDKIAFSISSLLGPNDYGDINLHNLFEITERNNFSVLSIGESKNTSNNSDIAVKGALKMLSKTANPSSADRVLLFLNSGQQLSTSDVASSINSVRGLIGKKLSHFTHGYKTSDSIQTTAIVLSSGFQSTIFDDYDPLSTLLAGKEIDDDLECNLDVDIGIDTISEA